LPWRIDYRPYSIWISEIMLQQTQMERAVAYFHNWLARFPDIRAVADAREDDVLAAWEGLGYYSRARNIMRAARVLLDDHGGEFPADYDAIRALPGIGDYTAGAIASIAFHLPVPAVDANVLRIFSRVLDLDRPVTDKAVREQVTAAAAALLPGNPPREVNQALMELGALVCAKTPRCSDCPVARFCLARANGTAAARPIPKAKPVFRDHVRVAVIVTVGDRVFIRKRPPRGLWAGLWEFPDGPVTDGEEPSAAAGKLLRVEFPDLPGPAEADIRPVAVVKHGYTTNRVTLHGYRIDLKPENGVPAGADAAGVWVDRERLGDFSFSAGHRKLLEFLGWKNRADTRKVTE
ncbi:MAG: A/G-specific adenine glycosylase, partial [Planctomycetaceae bacterium]|nr:A/G-specific adenine glycosylase [Planctomycetaceae bacterium]